VGVRAEVRWGGWARAGFALTIPLFVLVSAWSFHSIDAAGDPAGVVVATLCALFAVGALVLQVHCGRYEVVADVAGIEERSLRGVQRFAWRDVVGVECIAQRRRNGLIERWESYPEEAFHILIRTRHARIAVHRWMRGVDELVALLREVGALDRDRPLRREPPPLGEQVVRRYVAGVWLLRALVPVLLLSWLCGLLVMIKFQIRITGLPLVDATLTAALPWLVGAAALRLIRWRRMLRFGLAFARPPIDLRDGALTLGAALGGPLCLAGFAASLRHRSLERVDFLFLGVGLFFCGMAIVEVRRLLRER
jgi:hypothetical protein